MRRRLRAERRLDLALEALSLGLLFRRALVQSRFDLAAELLSLGLPHLLDGRELGGVFGVGLLRERKPPPRELLLLGPLLRLEPTPLPPLPPRQPRHLQHVGGARVRRREPRRRPCRARRPGCQPAARVALHRRAGLLTQGVRLVPQGIGQASPQRARRPGAARALDAQRRRVLVSLDAKRHLERRLLAARTTHERAACRRLQHDRRALILLLPSKGELVGEAVDVEARAAQLVQRRREQRLEDEALRGAARLPNQRRPPAGREQGVSKA